VNAPDRYTCEQVFRRLDDYVDRELTAEETKRVEQHLATCAQCASEARFERGLVDGLKAKMRQIDVPDSLVARIETALNRNRGPDDREES
jgi:anti-sigma factor (TIGR02949 family)